MGVKASVQGDITNYNAGGYMFKLGGDSATKESVLLKIQNFEKFLTANTLAFNLIMSGYILDLDYFYSINFLIERTPTGGFQAVKYQYDIFRPSLSWNYTFNLVGDIIVYILSIIQISINIKTLVQLWKQSKKAFFAFLKKILFVLTLLFFIIQLIYGIFNTISQIKAQGKELLTATDFVDARNTSSSFITSLRFKAFNTGVAILMMSVMLNHKITQKFTITILNETVIKNIQYLLLVIPIFIGMALVGSTVLGPYSTEFASFDKAMISVMLFTIGRINPGNIFKYDSTVGIIFILFFFVLSIFLSFTIFIGFGLQTYFGVMSSKGYYTPSWDNSNFQHFPRFAFFFLPSRFFERKQEDASKKADSGGGFSNLVNKHK